MMVFKGIGGRFGGAEHFAVELLVKYTWLELREFEFCIDLVKKFWGFISCHFFSDIKKVNVFIYYLDIGLCSEKDVKFLAKGCQESRGTGGDQLGLEFPNFLAPDPSKSIPCE